MKNKKSPPPLKEILAARLGGGLRAALSRGLYASHAPARDSGKSRVCGILCDVFALQP